MSGLLATHVDSNGGTTTYTPEPHSSEWSEIDYPPTATVNRPGISGE